MIHIEAIDKNNREFPGVGMEGSPRPARGPAGSVLQCLPRVETETGALVPKKKVLVRIAALA